MEKEHLEEPCNDVCGVNSQTITKCQAEKFTKAWAEFINRDGVTTDNELRNLREFTISTSEMQRLLDVATRNNAEVIRVYMGRNNPLIPSERTQIKLIFVAGTWERDHLTDCEIFDFTNPCPDTCSYGSPLLQPVVHHEK